MEELAQVDDTLVRQEPVVVGPVEGGADVALRVEALHELDDLQVGHSDSGGGVVAGEDGEIRGEVLLRSHDTLSEEVSQDELALALADEHDEKEVSEDEKRVKEG